MIAALAIPAAFLLALLMTAWLCHPRVPLRLLDQPNHRSLHDSPTPRTGGLAILAGLAAGFTVLWLSTVEETVIAPEFVRLVPAALAIAAISLVDDHRHVPAPVRLLIHLLTAGWVVAPIAFPGEAAGALALLWFATCLLAVAWMTNLYNFMDGMDGFAGGMAVMGFGTLAVLAALNDVPEYAWPCLVVAAAAAGFLAFNFPPARIFMGDAGSAVLGFMAGGLILHGDHAGAWHAWQGVLVFSPFIVDASVTLLRRLARREKVWQAHRSHHYQRLVRSGWGHRRTVLMAYALMLVVGVSVVIVPQPTSSVQWMLLPGWAAIYLWLILRVERIAPYP